MSDPQGKEYAAQLGQVIADLDLLNHNTEQDFLRIGGKLAESIEAVQLISSELTALADLASGEQGLRASQTLSSALDRSVETRTRAEEGSRALDRMCQDAARLKQTLAGFQGTVSTFKMLGMLTRMETARLGGAGTDFGNLSDDVKALAGTVQVQVEGALDAGNLLIPQIASAMQDISGLEEGQAQDVSSVISEALASLSSFRDIQETARRSSGRMRARYGAISDAFNKLIVSIQFHDITRQQVEHVIEVLRRLCSESEAENGNGSSKRWDTASILAVQSSQLADAGEKFAASVASVSRNLDEIATHVLEMADESRTLSGVSEDEKNSFFVHLERGCTAILAGLSQCAKAEAATRVTSGGLAETIDRMRRPVEGMRAAQIQMQRTAMNGCISAVRLGARGNVLGVLADSMQRLASECRERSELLVEWLGSMSEAATRLSGEGEAVPAGENGGWNGSLEALRTAVAEVHSSSERSFTRIDRITDCSARLREELSTTRQSFSVGAIFAEAVSRARRMLKEIGEKAQSGCPPDGAEASERALADFARHYTMQAERDVHEGVSKAGVGAPVAAPAEQAEFPSGENDELGDVEFF